MPTWPNVGTGPEKAKTAEDLAILGC